MYLPGIAVPLMVAAVTCALQSAFRLPEPDSDPDRMDRSSPR
jgi:hypothetical protein